MSRPGDNDGRTRTVYLTGHVIMYRVADRQVLSMHEDSWASWPAMERAGILRSEHGGPGTSGHRTLYVSQTTAAMAEVGR